MIMAYNEKLIILGTVISSIACLMLHLWEKHAQSKNHVKQLLLATICCKVLHCTYTFITHALIAGTL